MARTGPIDFLVKDLCEQSVSLKIIGNGNHGRIVEVPREHQQYDDEVECCLTQDVSRGAILEAKLQKDTTEEWCVSEIISHQKP